MEKDKKYCPFCGNRFSSKTVDGRERRYCVDCDQILWKNSKPVAGVGVVDGNRVLLVKRGIEPDKGQWSLPAGFLEYDEKPQEAAARELEEETGIKVDPEELEFLDTLLMDQEGRGYLLSLVYTVSRERTEGEPEAGDDAVKAKFWELEEFRDSDEVIRKHYLDQAQEAVHRFSD